MIDILNFISFQVHGGGLGGGLAAGLLSFFDFVDALLSKKPPEMFDFLFPGIAALENIHPILVHYPIAFFTMFFIFELSGLALKKPQWRYIAGWLLYLGTFAAAMAVVAGLYAADTVEHNDVVHGIMEKHEHFGIAVLSLGLFLSAWRKLGWGLHSTPSNGLFLFVSAVLCLLLSFGADLGGLMVYSYGVAVKPSADSLVMMKSDAVVMEHAGKNNDADAGAALNIAPNISGAAQNPGGHDHAGHHHGGHDHHH